MRSQSAIDHEDLNDDESEPVEVSDNDSETEDDEDDYHFELFSEEELDSFAHLSFSRIRGGSLNC